MFKKILLAVIGLSLFLNVTPISAQEDYPPNPVLTSSDYVETTINMLFLGDMTGFAMSVFNNFNPNTMELLQEDNEQTFNQLIRDRQNYHQERPGAFVDRKDPQSNEYTFIVTDKNTRLKTKATINIIQDQLANHFNPITEPIEFEIDSIARLYTDQTALLGSIRQKIKEESTIKDYLGNLSESDIHNTRLVEINHNNVGVNLLRLYTSHSTINYIGDIANSVSNNNFLYSEAVDLYNLLGVPRDVRVVKTYQHKLDPDTYTGVVDIVYDPGVTTGLYEYKFHDNSYIRIPFKITRRSMSTLNTPEDNKLLLFNEARALAKNKSIIEELKDVPNDYDFTSAINMLVPHHNETYTFDDKSTYNRGTYSLVNKLEDVEYHSTDYINENGFTRRSHSSDIYMGSYPIFKVVETRNFNADQPNGDYVGEVDYIFLDGTRGTAHIPYTIRRAIVKSYREDPTKDNGTQTPDDNDPNVIKVGTKPTESTEVITPKTIRYVADDTREYGYRNEVEGRDGVRRTRTTYTLTDPSSPDLTENTAVIEETEMVQTVITLGTKTKTEELPFDTVETRDDTKPVGYREVTRQGVKGSRTTTYTLNDQTGDIAEEVNTTDPVDELVTIGTRQPQRIYEPDLNRDYGTPNEETPQDNGDIIIKVGTKSKVVREDTPKTITYEKDDTKPYGERETIEGTDGYIERITTYEVNPNTGEVTENETERVEEMTPTIIKIGTQPRVEELNFEVEETQDPTKPETYREVTRNGVKGRRTTTYEVHTQTGEVTEEVETIDPINELVTIGTRKIQTIYEEDPTRDRETPNEETILDNGDKIIKVGTRPKVNNEVIPFNTIYEADPEKDYGSENITKQNGVDGVRTSTTTYTVNPQTGEVTENTTTETQDPVDKIIVVGTKTSTITTETEPFKTIYEGNPELDVDVENVVREGSNGNKTTTTTYTLNPNTGEVTPNEEVVNTPKVDKLIQKGTKPHVETEEIPVPVNYIYDNTLNPGDKVTESEGEPGTKTTTIELTVDPDTGVYYRKSSISVTDPKPKVIKVGTAPKVETEEIPFKVVYERDDELEVGQRNEIEGKVGTKTTTTPYRLNDNGELVEDEPTVIIEDPINKIIKVGTKTKIVEEPIQSTIVYREDPNLDPGKTREEGGTPGVKRTITTYELDEGGNLIPTEREVITDPTPTIIYIGTKTSVEITIKTPKVIKYIEDPNRDNNSGPRTLVEGQDGGTKITTTYTVVEGKLVPEVKEEEIPMIPSEISIGTKPSETYRNIPQKLIIEEDNSFTGERLKQEGRDGKIKVTTTYVLDKLTGKVTISSNEQEVEAMIPRIVVVGKLKVRGKNTSVANDLSMHYMTLISGIGAYLLLKKRKGEFK